MNKHLLILIIICIGLNVNAQFGRLGDKIKNKVTQKIEDKAADMIAEAIARKAYKAMDKATEDVLQKSFEDSLGTDKVDYEKMGRAYGDYLAGMNAALDKMPPQYQFDLVCDVKITDHKEKSNMSKMLYSSDGNVIGVQTTEKNETHTIVWDMKNEIMVSLSDEKGKKTGQILPSMNKIVAAYVKEEADKKKPEYKLTQNIDKKEFAGYSCIGHELETETDITRFYVAENFPLSFINAYDNFYKQFIPAGYIDGTGISKGFVLYTKTTDKKSKKTNTYEVVKINKEKLIITKVDYTFAQKS